MAKVITTELQHSGASGANITLDSSKNVTCENNLQVDGNVTVTGTLPADKLTGALPAISGASLTGISSPLSFRNLVINGSMQVAQRGTSDTANGYKTVDRWNTESGGHDELPTREQVAVTSGGAYDVGFRKALKITNGNQTSGAGTGDYMAILQPIEAQNLAQSGWNYVSTSSKITLSFWVKSSVAQNFYGYVASVDGTKQSYPFETGSLTANTWTKVTKTIPGASGIQIDNNNAAGFELQIYPFMGTDYTDAGVSLHAWAAYNGSQRMPNHTSTWWTTNDATFEITGVQLEVGDTATTFEHRSYGEELARCKRYYHRRTGHMMMAPYKISDSPDMGRKFSIFFNEMRVAPTVSGITHTTNGSTTVSVDTAYVDHIEFESGDVSDSTYVRIDTYQASAEL